MGETGNSTAGNVIGGFTNLFSAIGGIFISNTNRKMAENAEKFELERMNYAQGFREIENTKLEIEKDAAKRKALEYFKYASLVLIPIIIIALIIRIDKRKQLA